MTVRFHYDAAQVQEWVKRINVKVVAEVVHARRVL